MGRHYWTKGNGAVPGFLAAMQAFVLAAGQKLKCHKGRVAAKQPLAPPMPAGAQPTSSALRVVPVAAGRSHPCITAMHLRWCPLMCQADAVASP